MLQYILRDNPDAFRCHHDLFSVDIPDHLVSNFFLDIHSLDVINTEWKNIFIVNSVHDSVSMKLVTEGLCCCKKLRILCSAGIYRENRCSCKSEQMIFLKVLHDSCMHISKLASMAFVKYDYHMLRVNIMSRILLDKCRKLLNRCDNNASLRILQLSFQNSCRSVGIGCTLFKAVIFLHGLIVQILTVDNKHNFVNVRKL